MEPQFKRPQQSFRFNGKLISSKKGIEPGNRTSNFAVLLSAYAIKEISKTLKAITVILNQCITNYWYFLEDFRFSLFQLNGTISIKRKIKLRHKVLGDNLSKTKGEIREHVGDPAIYGLRTMEGNWLLLFSGMAADLETSQTCSQCSQFNYIAYWIKKNRVDSLFLANIFIAD